MFRIADVRCHFQAVSSNQSAELEALRSQVARLLAEKHDLVAMNSELQLKADQDSNSDSFIEVIRVSVNSSTHTHIINELYIQNLLLFTMEGPHLTL